MEPMTTTDVANGLVERVKAQDFDGAVRAYYDENIVSTEATGERAEGMAAIHAKNEWWATSFDVHSFEAEGPYVHGDLFIAKYVLDFTEKSSNQRMTMHETALYTVRNGKVVDEKFFSTPADLAMMAAG